ncbi:hypothetical protein [Roseinatronobacter ekhonensis]|jgi:hypothetical protein|nr:hypothetical protein [Roseibaca ekhonensis]
MPENLHDLLEGDDPVALRRIEQALHSTEPSSETVDTILSALIWRRCTAGKNGILGAVINYECAARISVLPRHLEKVGAAHAAQAMRDILEEIPLEDKQIEGGIIDWVDSNPDFARHAGALDERMEDVASKVWGFMQENQSDLPDYEIPDKRQGMLNTLLSGWQSLSRQRFSAGR